MLRATLTLLAGGALAQALPLLLGPLLTRLYTPDEFGAFHLFAAVATNLGVVACGRYEFALPLARDAGEAAVLWRLALRLAAGLGVLAGLGGIGWALQAGAGWALWLGPAVAVGGLLSLATMWATRHERFRALALARMLQYGGAALAQALAGVLHGGVAGLVIAPVLAQALAALAARGIDAGACLQASRMTLRGLLQWRIAVRPDGQRLFDGCLPTLIEWGAVHPTDSLPASGIALHALRLQHPDAAPLQAALHACGLTDIGVTPAAAPGIEAVLHTPRGPVVLSSTR